MNLFLRNGLSLFIVSMFLFIGCEDDKHNTLAVSPTTIDFLAEGGRANITIETNADSWKISNPASDWLSLSKDNGTIKSAVVVIDVNSKTIEPRIDTLVVTAGNATPVNVIVTQPSSEYVYELYADQSEFNFKRGESTAKINITTTAPDWNISTDVDWVQFSQVSGTSGSSSVDLTVLENTAVDERYATIQIVAEYAPSLQISVSQKGEYYPSYNTSPIDPDASGMGSTASEIAANINLGWNIGNSLEAIGGETAWGNPEVTKALIDLVKQSGFNAIRIPCSWNQYMANSTTAQIRTDWLDRVKEVIQYCVDNDMYVLLNIHWDGGWLENNCSLVKQEENNAKQKAFWEQIATHMRDFDEHVLFASANEPNVDNSTQMSVLNSYHQTFIDAVRSTGGRNSYRVLVVQGPSTDIQKTNELMATLPIDTVADKMMAEIHYYTPWNFCGMTTDESWGSMFYYWGSGYHSDTDTERNATWGEESTVDELFALMKSQFVDNGIPVILGEFGAVRRSSLTGDALTLHLASRAYFFKYVTKQANANGLLPFYWDNGGMDNNASAIFNRDNNTVFDQQALDALVQGANE